MNSNLIRKSEAIARIELRTCKKKGARYIAGYMDGLATAKRVIKAMPETEAQEVRQTYLVRREGDGHTHLLYWGNAVVYGEKNLICDCTKCGHVNIINAKYCSGCGAKVVSVGYAE